MQQTQYRQRSLINVSYTPIFRFLHCLHRDKETISVSGRKHFLLNSKNKTKKISKSPFPLHSSFYMTSAIKCESLVSFWQEGGHLTNIPSGSAIYNHVIENQHFIIKMPLLARKSSSVSFFPLKKVCIKIRYADDYSSRAWETRHFCSQATNWPLSPKWLSISCPHPPFTPYPLKRVVWLNWTLEPWLLHLPAYLSSLSITFQNVPRYKSISCLLYPAWQIAGIGSPSSSASGTGWRHKKELFELLWHGGTQTKFCGAPKGFSHTLDLRSTSCEWQNCSQFPCMILHAGSWWIMRIHPQGWILSRSRGRDMILRITLLLFPFPCPLKKAGDLYMNWEITTSQFEWHWCSSKQKVMQVTRNSILLCQWSVLRKHENCDSVLSGSYFARTCILCQNPIPHFLIHPGTFSSCIYLSSLAGDPGATRTPETNILFYLQYLCSAFCSSAHHWMLHQPGCIARNSEG